MRKITSTIIGLAIATILTASALTMSNQAFAQTDTRSDSLYVDGKLLFGPLALARLPNGKIPTGTTGLLGANVGITDQPVLGEQTQLGKVLGSHHGLGNNPNTTPYPTPIPEGLHSVQSTHAHIGQVLGGITATIHHILKGGTTTGLGEQSEIIKIVTYLTNPVKNPKPNTPPTEIPSVLTLSRQAFAQHSSALSINPSHLPIRGIIVNSLVPLIGFLISLR
jgi:hypothetical protein